VGPRAIDSLPDTFARLIERDPGAPAVVLRRGEGRERIWTRAAVEHRAVRIAALCADLGLAADARVAITGHGALDVVATAFFLLATGRVLTTPEDAVLVVDDALLARAHELRQPYTLRAVVFGRDAAARLGGATFTHTGLLRAALRHDARLGDDLLGRCLHALATGEPLVVDAHGGAEARNAVCAA
jgi:hypothetical protein